MKVLVVCQHYWPEPYPLQDVCDELVRRGHQVLVVTGVPNYPLGHIYPEYRKGRNREQTENGVRIHRCFTIGRRNNVIFRFLNYFSFAISSKLYLRHLKEEFDVVFTNQTSPVTMSGGAMVYGRKHRKKVVLYCMDLWPASLAAGGVGERSLIYRAFGRISKKIYRAADRILITSESFRDYLQTQFQIGDDRIVYHPQYANVTQIPQRSPDQKNVNLVFAGNIGTAQSIDTILKAAKHLEEVKQLWWHIVGDGSELENCKEMAAKLGLSNVIFHGRKPQSEIPEYMAMADGLLLTLTADPVISMTLPGKTQTYMASGKPIIAAANGEIPRVIADSCCGFCAPAEDAEALAGAVRDFMAHPDRRSLGENGKRYYQQHFSRERFMDALEQELDQQAKG